MTPRILVVADEPVADALRDTFEVAVAAGAAQALPLIEAETFVVVVLGLAGAAGLAVLRAALARSARTRYVLLAGAAAEADALAQASGGAGARLDGSALPGDLLRAVERALPFHEAVDVARAAAARRYLESLLREFDGNVTRAAERAGMDRENLHRLLRRFALRAADFRRPAGPAT